MSQAHVTLFPRAAASMSEALPMELSWERLAADITDFRYFEKKTDAPLLIPARFSEDAPKKEKRYVLDVHLATLDIDGVTQQELEALLRFITSKGLRAAVYSTFSHIDAALNDSENVKARIVFPLTRPVTIREWPVFWKAYNEYFFNLADPACKDPSRGYFVAAIPSKYEGTEAEEEVFAGVLDGTEDLDVDWLLSSYSEELASVGSAPPDQDTAHSVDRSLVLQLSRKLKRSNRGDLQVIGSKMLQGMKGEIFEAHGNRDNMLFKFAKELAHAFPNGKAEDLAAPFQQAIHAMAEDSGDAFNPKWLIDKILRAQTAELAEIESKKALQVQRQVEAEQQEKKILKEKGEYTKESLAEYLKQNGATNEDVDAFPLILVHQNRYYTFRGDGYAGPYHRNDLFVACKKYLDVQAKSLGFTRYIVKKSEDGPPKLIEKTISAVIGEYGSIVNDIEYNLHGHSYYESDSATLHLSSLSEIRMDEAEYSPEVDAWMRAVAQDEDTYQRFCEYMALFPRLDQSAPAICFIGPPSIGKTAFAEGMARMWRKSVVTMDEALGSFNGGLLESPVVLSDEDLPRDYRGRVQTEKFRKLISDSVHSVNRKGLPRVSMHGNLRCIIALNNVLNFNFGNSRNNSEDVGALEQRFFMIRVPSHDKDRVAALFLHDLFVKKGALWRHALYLMETRAQNKKLRFGMETNSKTYIQLADRSVSKVMRFVSEYVVGSDVFDESAMVVRLANPNPVLVLPGRRVFVSSGQLLREWDTIIKESPPAADDLYSTLSSISLHSKPTELRLGSSQNRWMYWEISPELVREYLWRTEGESKSVEKRLDIYYESSVRNSDLLPTAMQMRARAAAIEHFRKILVDEDSAASQPAE